MVQISSPADVQKNPPFAALWRSENFTSYYCVPLIAKGEVKGVLEVYNRASLPPKPDWLYYLETLAGQAAIAIDNTQLFENLQHANLELGVAYESTIEGWSHALDLRDQETEGHTQRVTEMTLNLAQHFKFNASELLTIRRGAILHDIGKMGVPDAILLKQGGLNEVELTIMRKHPVFAYEMLKPVYYLRDSLDIPYCHHEKWDGSGYPRGLAGENIPLTARIFAVVDVFDALTHDRPYRLAWPREKAFDYIREQSGKHFDPEVVIIFLRKFGKLG
jgi:putative nucleotidyltransferase with HDIG domain